MLRYRVGIVVLALALAPSAAHADWLVSPMAGYPFGADTLGRDHPSWGAGFGWLDREGLGLELDLAFAPDFFEGEKEDFTGSGSVLTLMGNFLLTGPFDARVMPYATAGVGYMQMRVTSDSGTFTTTTHETGYNLGAGLTARVAERVAVRGDLRYLRSFHDQPPAWTRGVDVDIAPGAFDFWRASVGVMLRLPE